MPSIRRTPRVAALVVTLAAATSLGCAVTVSETRPPPPHDNRPHPGEGDQARQASVTTLLKFSGESPALSRDQQAAAARLDAELRSKTDPQRAAESALLVALADAVSTGTVEEQKLADPIAKLGAAVATSRADAAAELNKLYATLDAAQRQALADEVIGRWSTATVDPARTPGFGRADQLVVLAPGLGLTNEQVTGIRKSSAVMTAPAVDSWRVDTQIRRLAQFKRDHFDANEFVGDQAKHALEVTEEAKRVARFYGAVAPVANTAQRAKLSQWLRDRASKPDAPTPPFPQ